MSKPLYNPYKYASLILAIVAAVLLGIYLLNPTYVWKRVDKSSLKDLVEYISDNPDSQFCDSAFTCIGTLTKDLQGEQIVPAMEAVKDLTPQRLSDYHLLAQLYSAGMDYARSKADSYGSFKRQSDARIYDTAKERMDSLINNYINVLMKDGADPDWLKFSNFVGKEYWTSEVYPKVEQAEINTFWYPEEKGWNEANKTPSFEYKPEYAEYKILSDNSYYTYPKSSIDDFGWSNVEELYPHGKVWMTKDNKGEYVPFSSVQQYEGNGYSLEDVNYLHHKREAQIALLNRFLRYYPEGNYAEVAKEKLIELTVADVFDKQHGSLPKAQSMGGKYGSESSITIKNDTQYGLNIYYSGPTQTMLYLSTGNSQTVNLPNGEYRIAVKADGGNVSDYAGLDLYEGGKYSYSLYIVGQYHWNNTTSVKYNSSSGTFDIHY